MSLDSQVALLPYESSSFATGGSMSLDSQVALLPYESSSFATLFRGRINRSTLTSGIMWHIA